MPLLSIIIPVYNASKFISDTLNSIFDQFDDRVEVILIDDGSNDNTLEIIYSKFMLWIDAFNLIIIKQENLGPGSARNQGIKICNGQFITFLDADDLLLKDYFKTLMPILHQSKYDIVEHGFLRFNDKNDLYKLKFSPLYNFVGGYNVRNIRDKIFAKTVWYPSIRIFKNDIWKNLRFNEGVFYEDPMTIHKIFLNNHSIYFLNRPFLGYRINPKSVSSVHLDSHMMDLANFYFSLTPNSLSIIILKVRLARSILFFHHELNIHSDIMKKILNDLNKTVDLKIKMQIFLNLKFFDMFFLLFTNSYIIINKSRFIYKNFINKVY